MKVCIRFPEKMSEPVKGYFQQLSDEMAWMIKNLIQYHIDFCILLSAIHRVESKRLGIRIRYE